MLTVVSIIINIHMHKALSEILVAGLQRHAAFLKQPSLMWTRNFGTYWWSTRLQIELSSMWGRMIFGKSSQNSLRRLNTWLQWSCGIKGVNFIDNFNIFWGHRQLFILDGLHLNRLGARVLMDNIYFSLRHPSVMFANPLCLNGTHTHLDRV